MAMARVRWRDIQQSQAYIRINMTNTTSAPSLVHGNISTQPRLKQHVRKTKNWTVREHQIYLAACELAVAEGHHHGKCFTKAVWDRILSLFNKLVDKNWMDTHLKNYWQQMQTDHNLLFELPICTGVAYDQTTGNRVKDVDEWWEKET